MYPRLPNHLVRAGAIAMTLALTANTSAEDGVTKDKILFGQAAGLEGPASALGKGMQLGIRAAFEMAISKGGVNGRFTFSFGPEDNHGMDKVFLTQINPDSSFRPVARLTM